MPISPTMKKPLIAGAGAIAAAAIAVGGVVLVNGSDDQKPAPAAESANEDTSSASPQSPSSTPNTEERENPVTQNHEQEMSSEDMSHIDSENVKDTANFQPQTGEFDDSASYGDNSFMNTEEGDKKLADVTRSSFRDSAGKPLNDAGVQVMVYNIRDEGDATVFDISVNNTSNKPYTLAPILISSIDAEGNFVSSVEQSSAATLTGSVQPGKAISSTLKMDSVVDNIAVPSYSEGVFYTFRK